MIILNNINWKLYNKVLIPDVAPHVRIEPDEKDKKYLLNKSKAVFLRWTTEWDKKIQSNFWYIIKDSYSSLNEMSGNTRSKIRRGLKNCKVEKVTRKYIIENAYMVYKNAFLRYRTKEKPFSYKDFKNNLQMEDSGGNMEYWAVWNKEGSIIAYSVNSIQQNTCNYSSIKFDPQYMKLYSSYALFYVMNKYYLKEKKLYYVNNGARSLLHDTNIQNYLIEKFKFRKAYCRLNVYYTWYANIIVKAIFPVKNIINRINNSYFDKINLLIKHEEIAKRFNDI